MPVHKTNNGLFVMTLFEAHIPYKSYSTQGFKVLWCVKDINSAVVDL